MYVFIYIILFIHLLYLFIYFMYSFIVFLLFIDLKHRWATFFLKWAISKMLSTSSGRNIFNNERIQPNPIRHKMYKRKLRFSDSSVYLAGAHPEISLNREVLNKIVYKKN
jgi:hypothetical protein